MEVPGWFILLLFIFSLGGAIYLFYDYFKLDNKYSKLIKEYNELVDKYVNLNKKYLDIVNLKNTYESVIKYCEMERTKRKK